MPGYYQGLLGAQTQLADLEHRRRATGLLDLQTQRAQAEMQRESELAPLRFAQEQGKLAEFQAGRPLRQATQEEQLRGLRTKGEEGALGMQEKRLKMLTTAKNLFTSVGDQQSLDQANQQFEQFTGQPSPYRAKPFTPDFREKVTNDLATITQRIKMQELQQKAGSKQKEMETKRQFNMQGIGALIQQADDMLSGVKRDETGAKQPATLPTGSGAGALYDIAGAFIGASPSGSVEAQQLKAIGGALTAKMPRMEGPQSDRDVQLYREMAAEIGNPWLPIDRRKAALETVKQLWVKYEHLNPQGFAERRQPPDIGAPPPGAVRPR